jgi:hypothetical protein
MKTRIYISCISFLVAMMISSIGIAQKTLVEDYSKKFKNGEIIVSDDATTKGKLKISDSTYQSNVVGVYLKYEKLNTNDNTPKLVPVSDVVKSEGVAYVKYNSQNGTIKKGDPVTTSTEAGVGMKATQSGIIVGIAEEDATAVSGLIKIRISVQYIYIPK